MKHCEYTKEELRNYCKDKNGYVKCVKQPMHIGLPPWGLSSLRNTIRDIVLEKKFDPLDKGIVIGIGHIKILGREYVIHNESAALHVNLIVKFYVLIPPENDGMSGIDGIIKHVGLHHISVTVFRFFNVRIPMGKTDNLKKGMTVKVTITKFNFDFAIPHLEGTLEIANYDRDSSTDSGISSPRNKVNGEQSTSVQKTESDDSNKNTTPIKIKQEPSSELSSDESDSVSDASTNRVIKKERSSTSSSSSDERIPNKKTTRTSTLAKPWKRKHEAKNCENDKNENSSDIEDEETVRTKKLKKEMALSLSSPNSPLFSSTKLHASPPTKLPPSPPTKLHPSPPTKLHPSPPTKRKKKLHTKLPKASELIAKYLNN